MLRRIYHKLFRAYGPQGWWPADDAFEVMIGAILTQNTAWSNVEQAIAGLRKHDCLKPERILEIHPRRLAKLIKPSGYFNIKAKRLRNLCRWYLDQGGMTVLTGMDTDSLRKGLLAVNGVGPETADDILLYAFDRPVFVVDAYTRRLFGRCGLIDPQLPYETFRTEVERKLKGDAPLYNEYHALIVHHAKVACRTKPVCDGCCLQTVCAFSAQ